MNLMVLSEVMAIISLLEFLVVKWRPDTVCQKLGLSKNKMNEDRYDFSNSHKGNGPGFLYADVDEICGAITMRECKEA